MTGGVGAREGRTNEASGALGRESPVLSGSLSSVQIQSPTGPERPNLELLKSPRAETQTQKFQP